jgi:ketosteroid isomerase-like protein
MKTTKQVIDQYMDGYETCDIDQVMSVFDETSVLIYGADVYRGLKEIRDFFTYIMSEVLPPGVEINDIHQVIEDDVAFFVWSAKSGKCKISLGMDTFFIRNGVISRQTAYLAIED